MDTKKIWNEWQEFLPVGPFKVSVKMWAGKNQTLKYRYIHFQNPKQFKTWLRKNGDRLCAVINIL